MSAFKFFNVGKANEEITRLESEVTRLTGELQTAAENSKAVEAEAEKLRTDLAAAQGEITKLKETSSELAAANTSIATLTKERDELKAAIEKPDGIIEQRAAIKAAELTRAQGLPEPLPNTPGNKEPQTWTERCKAALSAKTPQTN